MSVDIFKEVRWTEGEGVPPGDLTDMQRFLRATLLDGLVQPLCRAEGNEGRIDEVDPNIFAPDFLPLDIPDAANLFAVGPGAFPRQGRLGFGFAFPPNRSIDNFGAGVLLQQQPGIFPDGSDAKLLMYRVAAGDLGTTFDVGDPANPRIDLVQVKLSLDENQDPQERDVQDASTGAITTATDPPLFKKRKVILTKSVKKGTPAATPAAPAPDAGYARWASVFIAANFDAPFNPDDDRIRDHRYPVGSGYQSMLVPSWQMFASAGFALQGDGSRKAANPGDTCLAVLPGGPWRNGRVLRFYLNHALTHGGGVGEIDVLLFDCSDFSPSILGTIPLNVPVQDADTFSPGTRLPAPLWGNGRAAGLAHDDQCVLAIRFTAGATNDIVRSVRFQLVG